MVCQGHNWETTCFRQSNPRKERQCVKHQPTPASVRAVSRQSPICGHGTGQDAAQCRWRYGQMQAVQRQPGFKAADYLLHVEMAFQGLLDGSIPTDDVSTVDVLAQAIDVSKFGCLKFPARLIQVSRYWPPATGAIQRARSAGSVPGNGDWMVPAMQELRDAISVYEEVLLASSPMQNA